MSAKPRIKIIGTGGTIVSSGASASQLSGYSISGMTSEQLVNSIPELKEIAEIGFVSASEIDSSDMNSKIWCTLVKEIQKAFNEEGYDGVVITHGTDTMEETAFVLNLILKTDKPVVLTGAMRPATAMSADGPLNLFSAVRVACDEEAAGKGVLIVLNGTINGARDATKAHTVAVETFQSPSFGQLGYVYGNEVEFVCESLKPHTRLSEFELSDLVEGNLPPVKIVYAHADDSGLDVESVLKKGIKGVVVAAAGNGTLSSVMEKDLAEAVKKGLAVVRASRITAGPVLPGKKEWSDLGIVTSGTLTAIKSRLLLQLCLSRFGVDNKEIARCFKTY